MDRPRPTAPIASTCVPASGRPWGLAAGAGRVAWVTGDGSGEGCRLWLADGPPSTARLLRARPGFAAMIGSGCRPTRLVLDDRAIYVGLDDRVVAVPHDDGPALSFELGDGAARVNDLAIGAGGLQVRSTDGTGDDHFAELRDEALRPLGRRRADAAAPPHQLVGDGVHTLLIGADRLLRLAPWPAQWLVPTGMRVAAAALAGDGVVVATAEGQLCWSRAPGRPWRIWDLPADGRAPHTMAIAAHAGGAVLAYAVSGPDGVVDGSLVAMTPDELAPRWLWRGADTITSVALLATRACFTLARGELADVELRRPRRGDPG